VGIREVRVGKKAVDETQRDGRGRGVDGVMEETGGNGYSSTRMSWYSSRQRCANEDEDHVYTSCTDIELSRSNNNLLSHEFRRRRSYRRRDGPLPRETGKLLQHVNERRSTICKQQTSTIPPASRT
jgi:hypothetical protein